MRDDAALQRRTMIVLAITQVVGTVGVGIAPSIGVLLAGEVTQNEAWAGLARTASTLGAALIGLPLGSLAARRGRRVALASGWWLAAFGAALLVASAQWSEPITLFAGLLAIGAGSAASLQSRFAATDLADPRHRGRSLALIVWVGTIGSVLGPNLGAPGAVVGRATGLTTFAAAFLIAAVCLALAGALVFALLRPDPLLRRQTTGTATAGGRPRGPRFGAVFAEIRRNPSARLAVIAIVTAQIVMVAVMTMTPVHIAHEGGSINIIGITISLHILGMYALSPVVGIAADRLGACSLGIGAWRPHDMSWVMASLILLGLGWSFVNVAGSALFSAAVSDATRASSQGGIDALSNLCGAAAAFAAGPLLVISSFSTLSLIAAAVLAPLTVLLVIAARRGRGAGRTSPSTRRTEPS
jgi:MFS family permease